MEKEELELIKSCIKNNRHAQKHLYLKHKTKWSMVCLRYSTDRSKAEDMLQDALVSIFTNIRQFNHKKGNFSQWSHRIVVNACLQYLRKWNHLIFNKEIDYSNDSMGEMSNNHDHLGAKELTAIIQQLPDGYRVVFNMYVIEGYKHREIAELLKISVGTSKSQLAKAKKLLRKRLENILQT